MLKKATNNLNNSAAYNPRQDDLTAMNYLALAWAIVGVEVDGKIKYPNVTKACSSFGLYNIRPYQKAIEVNRKQNIKVKFLVENVETWEKQICLGSEAVRDAIGIAINSIPSYADRNYKYKGIYKITKVPTANNRGCRRTKATNIETNEVKEFKSVGDAAKFIGKSTGSINRYIRLKSIVDNWEFEYLE